MCILIYQCVWAYDVKVGESIHYALVRMRLSTCCFPRCYNRMKEQFTTCSFIKPCISDLELITLTFTVSCAFIRLLLVCEERV